MTSQLSNHHVDKRTEAFALVALSALVVLFFWKMIFANLIIARGDLFNYFYPYRDYAASALREGRLPLWNPYLFMGAPFLANSQVGFFYPLNLASSWLEVTRAVNLSIVAHSWIAAVGAYAFARRLGASILAAWLGGALFGLGGYLGAQVEHLNQLEALAWIPWLWLAYDAAAGRWLRGSLVAACAPLCGVGLLVSLMILAGHTQSVFIALVGLTVYALWPAIAQLRQPRQTIRTALMRFSPIAIAVVAGVLLAAIQLLPTLELTGLSPREGGLTINEAVSFSLDPRLIGRALLPDYDGALPAGSEFTAFFGVSALVLMLVGWLVSWSSHQPTIQPANHPANQAPLRALSIVTLLGLFLALGGFNPTYYALVRLVPGFDLFRAPARWLALFAFGGSMLAAVGLDRIGRGLTRRTQIEIVLPLLAVGILIGTTFVGATVTPAGAAGPVGAPSGTSLLLWGAASILTLLLARILRSRSGGHALQLPPSNLHLPTSNPTPLRYGGHGLQSLIVVMCCLELFVATRSLPYNARLTAPDALTDLRPSLTQLLVGATDTPPARFLSISDILFDPGDSAELESIFADQLAPAAYHDLLIASKQKEIAAPNLPLYYRLPAVDGYDGGLLPLQNYLAFQRLFLPLDAIQSDGRLREQLKAIPAARWLDLMNVKYVITDKVRDRWLDGVFYDLQFVTRLGPDQEVFTDQLPPLEADALGIVYSEPAGNFTLAEVTLTFADGSIQKLPLTDEPVDIVDGLSVQRLEWRQRKQVASIRVSGSGGLTIQGVALIDQLSNTFHSFVLAQAGRFRLAHSGDVKVYENVDVLPRAFVVPQARIVLSEDEAISVMSSVEFDPSQTVVLYGTQSGVSGRESNFQLPTSNLQSPISNLLVHDPERVVIEVNSDSDGYLVLTDAWYPGWTATVDGAPAEVLRADVTFRAVRIGAGAHRVEFRFEPQTFRIGAAISVGAWAIVVSVLTFTTHTLPALRRRGQATSRRVPS